MEDSTQEPGEILFLSRSDVCSLPDAPIASKVPAVLHELADISGRPAGPIRRLYRRLDDEAQDELHEAVEPLLDFVRELAR